MFYTKSVLLLLYLLCTSASAATIYKRTDLAGNLYFSDIPLKNAQAIILAPINTSSPKTKLPRQTKQETKQSLTLKKRD